MKDQTRRAVAYIVGQLISGTTRPSIYDHTSAQYFNFNGNSSPENVNVYDCAQGCYITGSLRGGSYRLFHYGNDRYLTLEIQGSRFRGYDYDTGHGFSGEVSGSSVTIFDEERSRFFEYSV